MLSRLLQLNTAGILLSLLVTITAGPAQSASFQLEPTAREKRIINIGWKYYKGDVTGAEAAAFADNSWPTVSLPHTFEYSPLIGNNFYRGIGWYRKKIAISQADVNKRITLYFEGAMTVAEVWINGTKLATHHGGFNPFCYDITSNVLFGSDNLIAVRVDNRYQNKVPPEKPDNSELDFILYGGLYRDVYIIKTNKDLFVPEPIHSWNTGWTEGGGHFITFPSVLPASATINVATWVKNAGSAAKNCKLVSVLVDTSNQIIASTETTQSAVANGMTRANQTLSVTAAHLWSPWDPYLYNLYTTVYDENIAVDYYKTTIGIRKLEFTRDSGCKINGQRVKLLGTNRHQIWPFVGHAVPNIQQRRDAALLKDMGCNFVRLSHYLQDDAFMDECDRLGILTFVEIPGWHCCNTYTPDSLWISRILDAVTSNVRTDRNHPGVAIWGVGVNELGSHTDIETRFNARCKAEDATRPTSQARNYSTGTNIYDFYGNNSFTSIPASNPASDATAGYMVTEHTGHTFPTARSDEARMIQLGTIHELMTAFGRKAPWIAGTLGWCAFDYNTKWGAAVAYHGAMDVMHVPKFNYYFYKSQSAGDNYDGSKHPMVFIANYYSAGSPLDRKIYSNCEQVRLYRNNQLIATQGPDTAPIDVSGFTNDLSPKSFAQNLAHPAFTFKNVVFIAGEIKAEGLIGGQVKATHIVKTPLAPAAVVLRADPPVIEANGADFSRIIASVVDANGTVVPNATNTITFAVSGSASLIYQNSMAAQAGYAIALAKASLTAETVTISSSASGLSGGSVQVTVAAQGTTGVTRENTSAPSMKTGYNGTFTIAGDHFVVPRRFAGKPVGVALYDVQGRLVQKAIVTKSMVNLSRDFGLARGVYVIKIKRACTGNK